MLQTYVEIISVSSQKSAHFEQIPPPSFTSKFLYRYFSLM